MIKTFKTQLNVSKSDVYAEFKSLLESAYNWSRVTETEKDKTVLFYLTDTLYFELHSEESDKIEFTMYDAFGNTKSISCGDNHANMILRKCGSALTISIDKSGMDLRGYRNVFDFVVSRINGKPCVVYGDRDRLNVFGDERNGNLDIMIVYDVTNRINPSFDTQLAPVYDPYQDGEIDNLYQMLFCSVSDGVRFNLKNVEHLRGTNLVIGGE